MTRIAQELDRKLQSVDKDTALRLERLVRDAMDLAQAAPCGDDFERLLGEEDALRAQMGQAGRRFSAQDRLSRDEVHDRDALR
jgi:hypothetical protein